MALKKIEGDLLALANNKKLGQLNQTQLKILKGGKKGNLCSSSESSESISHAELPSLKAPKITKQNKKAVCIFDHQSSTSEETETYFNIKNSL
jgi:hypothetical protein